MFIRPADWMQFQTPNGLDFRSIKNTRGKAISSTMDKLDAMKEFRKDEIFDLLNQQYANMELQEPKEVRENSIVLIRNIGNEPKREPLKFARIDKIHESRDNAQRVVTLTYNNVRINKDGEWIGTPIRVERSVNDLVLVDNALSDSMLGSRTPNTKKNEKEEQQKEKIPNDDEIIEVSENMATNNGEDPEPAAVVHVDDGTNNINDDENTDANERANKENKMRRSSRKRIQRMTIESDEIGDCDNENDPDYKS